MCSSRVALWARASRARGDTSRAPESFCTRGELFAARLEARPQGRLSPHSVDVVQAQALASQTGAESLAAPGWNQQRHSEVRRQAGGFLSRAVFQWTVNFKLRSVHPVSDRALRCKASKQGRPGHHPDLTRILEVFYCKPPASRRFGWQRAPLRKPCLGWDRRLGLYSAMAVFGRGAREGGGIRRQWSWTFASDRSRGRAFAILGNSASARRAVSPRRAPCTGAGPRSNSFTSDG